jgi:dihydropyrimidine dehydrogenase (NADP+)
MATGGIDSADVAVQFFHCGAGVVQICSAVHNQEFTVVQDYITGLKAYLYMQSRPDLANWDFQSPPKGAVPSVGQIVGRGLPKFGEYEKERKKLKTEAALKADILQVAPVVPAQAPVGKAPSVKDQVGRAVSRIGQYNDLDNKVLSLSNCYLTILATSCCPCGF